MPKGIYKRIKPVSEETRKKLSKASKGRIPWIKGKHHTEETKKKLGNIWKGKKRPPFSDEWKEKIGKSNLGIKQSVEQIRKRVEKNTGQRRTEEQRKRQSEAQKGEKSWSWKGGISSVENRIKIGIEWRLWRETVFGRDGFTCQKCRQIGGTLHPHHIRNFAKHLEIRFAIDNGITFCKNCHRLFHHIYGNRNNNLEQVLEFINDKENVS